MSDYKENDQNDQSFIRGKLFIGGLTIDTTEDDLREYFSKFGELLSACVKTDASGRSRCFGFIDFKNDTSIDELLKEKQIIKGKEIEIKRAVSRADMSSTFTPTLDYKKKIFIGRLHPEVTDENLKEYFLKFGKLESCFVMRYPKTNQSKGFGFAVFSTAEEADKVLSSGPHSILGHEVDVKLAIPRDPLSSKKEKFSSQPGNSNYRNNDYSSSSKNQSRYFYQQLCDLSDYVNSQISSLTRFMDDTRSDPNAYMPPSLYQPITDLLTSTHFMNSSSSYSSRMPPAMPPPYAYNSNDNYYQQYSTAASTSTVPPSFTAASPPTFLHGNDDEFYSGYPSTTAPTNILPPPPRSLSTDYNDHTYNGREHTPNSRNTYPTRTSNYTPY